MTAVALPDPLTEAELLAADAIGDVIEHWGFRKALGRVWTVLYLGGDALPAQEIAERLSMSAGAVSTALTELQRWGVVHRVWRPGGRKEYFEAETNFWKMISKVVSEREKFLAESVHDRLDRARQAALSAARGERRDAVIARIERLRSFANVAQSVMDSFIASQKADFQRFGNLLSLAREKVSARVRR
jgi:DNA-binding transcriptional regulator GbsR (MarR family)